MPTFATPDPITATVEVAGAQVRVTASDRTDAAVLVEPINARSRKDAKAAENTKVELVDRQLSVKMKTAGDKKGSVAITIDLPAESSLTAYLAFSSVQVAGPVGRCEVHMASGQIQLDSIEALNASIATGELTIGRIAGSADIEGGAFATRIDDVAGDLSLSNGGGKAWIGHAGGDLDLRSGSCEFDVERADGSVTGTTGSGAMRIGRMTNGQAKLVSGSGNIEVGISEGTTTSVDAGSKRGAVHDFVTSHGNPGPSGHQVMLHARTRHGDIIIQRAS